MANELTGPVRRELLEQVRAMLRNDEAFATLSDEALAHDVVEYAPEAVPAEMRLRVREMLITEALQEVQRATEE